MRAMRATALALTAASLLALAPVAPAQAGVLSPLCPVLNHAPLVPGCSVASHALKAGRELAGGNVGGLVGGAASSLAETGLGAIASWAASGAAYALHETAVLIDATTTPRLQAPWFQHVYWRLAGISVLLTLPCLFAAAVQALLRADLPLLVRAAFGSLPAAMLAVGICAQLTSLLLAAVDELCSLVSGAAGQDATRFLDRAGAGIIALSIGRSPFLAFVIAAFTVAGAIALWLELMMRAAAVYVVVAMLPLAFAAFVWPARRVWALRAVELLAALILAKLAMITVLTLGGAALESAPNVAGFLAGLVLLLLGVFSPWAMLRMVPMAELAAGAAGRLRHEPGIVKAQELVGGVAASAAQSLAPAAAAQLIRGGGAARAAAESVIAHMTGNTDQPNAASASSSNPEDDNALADSGPEPPSTDPSERAEPHIETPPSIFTAPNYSLPELELSGAARWRDAPLFTPEDHPPGRTGNAAEPTPTQDDEPPSVSSPELGPARPFEGDSPDLSPDDNEA